MKRVEDNIFKIYIQIDNEMTCLWINFGHYAFWESVVLLFATNLLRVEKKPEMVFKLFFLLCYAFSTCYAKPNVVIIMADDYVSGILMEICHEVLELLLSRDHMMQVITVQIKY